MTGRAVMWVGWLTVVLSLGGMAAYFAVAGFHLADVVGVIAVVVGVIGLVLGLYGLVLARREAASGVSSAEAVPVPADLEAGGVRNTFESGTVHGPVVMGGSIDASVSGGMAPGVGSRPPQEATDPQTAESCGQAVPPPSDTTGVLNSFTAQTVDGPVVMGRNIKGRISSGGPVPGAPTPYTDTADMRAEQPSSELEGGSRR